MDSGKCNVNKKSKLKQSDKTPAMPNKKLRINFRDIMFSEILNLPDEMVELL